VLGLLLTLKGGRINKCSKCANFFQEAFSFFCVLFHGVRSRQSSFDFFKKKLCDKDLFNKAPVKIRKNFFAIVLVAFYTEFWTQFQKLC